MSGTDWEIRASFDRRGEPPDLSSILGASSEALFEASSSFVSSHWRAKQAWIWFPVSIEWRSSPARLIASSIAGRHEPAWVSSLAVACSPWQWRTFGVVGPKLAIEEVVGMPQ